MRGRERGGRRERRRGIKQADSEPRVIEHGEKWIKSDTQNFQFRILYISCIASKLKFVNSEEQKVRDHDEKQNKFLKEKWRGRRNNVDRPFDTSGIFLSL